MTRGRPIEKSYDVSSLMEELLKITAEVYNTTSEIKTTALELGLPPNKIKKLLITAGVLNYPETQQIQELQAQGKSMEEIQESLGLSRSAINTYLPYSKVIYKMNEISQNAERVKKYKERKAAVEELEAALAMVTNANRNDRMNADGIGRTEAALWTCIIAFQHYPFHTASGLPFTYRLKAGRDGAYTKELFIDRRENSKSLAWSSVRLAFFKAVEKMDTVFDRPKAVGDIRGISYIYDLLWRFGVIQVPREIAERLGGRKR
ncbi:hypothetical protein AALB64_15740 [Lachnospiraceae bacterium 45-P1]